DAGEVSFGRARRVVAAGGVLEGGPAQGGHETNLPRGGGGTGPRGCQHRPKAPRQIFQNEQRYPPPPRGVDQRRKVHMSCSAHDCVLTPRPCGGARQIELCWTEPLVGGRNAVSPLWRFLRPSPPASLVVHGGRASRKHRLSCRAPPACPCLHPAAGPPRA